MIVVNIHQPSSDVYKLFDRLWLLDKGGYPVYDGNPIEAVSRFKTLAHYADSRTSTCPVCGNVNPEIILNIIDEKALSNTCSRDFSAQLQPDGANSPGQRRCAQGIYRYARKHFHRPAFGRCKAVPQARRRRIRQKPPGFLLLYKNLLEQQPDRPLRIIQGSGPLPVGFSGHPGVENIQQPLFYGIGRCVCKPPRCRGGAQEYKSGIPPRIYNT